MLAAWKYIKLELAVEATWPRNLSLVLTDVPSLSPAVDMLVLWGGVSIQLHYSGTSAEVSFFARE